MNMSKFKPTDVSFTHVVDLYLTELRKGTTLSIDVLCEAFPHLSTEIAEQLPALVLLEQSIGNPRSQPELNNDDVLAGCKIVREVGRGAVGVVYEAIQLDLGRKVALKAIPIDGSSGSHVVERFELERKAMGRLEHPHIVPVYSYGHNSEYAFLIMKLIDGHSLYDLQNGQQCDFRTQAQFNEIQTDWHSLAKLGSNVASGLEHAHQQGMVHRDIKPGNLLLDPSGKIWITDFGLAKFYDCARSLTGTGDAIGTPRYMAPEQLRGSCDARSDVYSLGITLYEIASSQRAWSDRSNLEIVTNRSSIALSDLAEIRPDIPESLAKIIMKACAFSPDERYASARELQIVLDRFLSGVSRADRRKRKREPDEVFRRKAKRQMILTSAFALLISFGLGSYLFFDAPAKEENATVLVSQDSLPKADSAIRLIDKLADTSQEDMVEIVRDFVSESLSESSSDLHFSEQSKKQIEQQVDHFATSIRENGGLTEQSLEKFLKGYRETALPIATKVMRLSIVVQKSRLNENERKMAISTLQRLATSAVARVLTEGEVTGLVGSLVGNNVNSLEAIAALQIPDARLRSWLISVNTRLASLSPMHREQSDAVQRDLNQVFSGALGSESTLPTTERGRERQ